MHTIPADRSAQTLRIMDAVAAGERILRAVDPCQLDATTSALADMLDENGDDVGRFVERANAYLGTMLEHSDAFYNDLRLLGDVAQGAADAEPHLVAALRNSHDTLRLIVDQKRNVDRLITGTTGLSSETTASSTDNERNLVGTVYAGEPIVHVYNGRRDKLAALLQAVPKVLSNGANGVEDGKIVMEGLMQFPFEFGKPYNSGDCVRYVGRPRPNCAAAAATTPPTGGTDEEPRHVVRHAPGPAVGVTAFAVVAVVMTMLVAGTLMKGAGTDPEEYHAVFRDTNGLTEGDDVRMAGVRVGRVEKRELEDGLAHVTFTVSGDQQVHSDSRAEINFLNLIGQRYLDITRGSPDEPAPAGATIPVSRTSPGLDLTALFNAFKPLFDLLRPADVNELATQITAVLQGQGPTINDLVAQTAKLTSHLAERDEVIGRVITNMSTVMETTAAHREDLRVLISELGELTHGLAGDRQQIGTALDSMAQLSIAMDDLTRRTRRPLTTDIGHINTLSGLVNKQTDILTKGLRGAPRAARRLRAVDELRQLAEHLHLLVELPPAQRRHHRRSRRRRQHEGVPVRRLTSRLRGPGPWSTSRLAVALVVLAVSKLLPGTTTYTADFANASGITTGDVVRVAGIDVGKVHRRAARARRRARASSPPRRVWRSEAPLAPRSSWPRSSVSTTSTSCRARAAGSTAAAPSRWHRPSRRTPSTASRSTRTTPSRPSTRRPSRRRSTPSPQPRRRPRRQPGGAEGHRPGLPDDREP